LINSSRWNWSENKRKQKRRPLKGVLYCCFTYWQTYYKDQLSGEKRKDPYNLSSLSKPREWLTTDSEIVDRSEGSNTNTKSILWQIRNPFGQNKIAWQEEGWITPSSLTYFIQKRKEEESLIDASLLWLRLLFQFVSKFFFGYHELK
jgi:hypothetical protein